MGVQDLFNWYQKKIGTYDKQLWEKTLEQRIIQGFTHIQKKSAKPKTDLIDLDLIRGSSFTKAKSKHGFITVTRLATIRLIFLPLYANWWVQQTSGKVFCLFLLIYLAQFVNVALYWHNTSNEPSESQTVPCSEIVIPIVLMWFLSVVHSEIVATKSGPEQKHSKVKTHKQYRRKRNRGKRVSIGKTLSDDTDAYTQSKDISGPYRRKAKWDRKIETLVDDNSSNKCETVEAEIEVQAGSSKEDTGLCISDKNDSPRSKVVKTKVLNNGQVIEDDGFESLNSNSSTPSDNGDDSNVSKQASPDTVDNVEDELVKQCDTRNKEEVRPNERCDAWVRSLQEKKDVSKLSRQQSTASMLQDSSDSESDTSVKITETRKTKLMSRRSSQIPLLKISSTVDSTCDTDDEAFSSPEIGMNYTVPTEATNSGTDWIGVTTNSEDCSYSSEYNESDSQVDSTYDHLTHEFDLSPTAILSPCCAPSDKVSCTIWERSEIKKADLSVFDISSAIISKVESMPDSMDYLYIGISISTIIALVPALFRLSNLSYENGTSLAISLNGTPEILLQQLSTSFIVISDAALGTAPWERAIMIIAGLERWILATIFFFQLAVAERTFKQRFLYAKLFSHLTSSRRARKSDLPHFRLNKVRNIKTWLSVRSYLKKRGLQRSVDVIVSAAFIVALLLLSFLSMELLKDTVGLHSQYNIEAMVWSFGLGIMLLRFMTLGTKINRKYRNLSVLITEQINLYLQIEQKAEKKEELMVANSVLKLAADLLKELESPFKISGLSANPYLYNITKVVILSALSGVLSDMLGFKLKLHKIKVK